MILLFLMSSFFVYSQQSSIYRLKSIAKEQLFFVTPCLAEVIQDIKTPLLHKKVVFVEGYEWSAKKQIQLNELINNSLITKIECMPVYLPKKGVEITLFYKTGCDCQLKKSSPFDSNAACIIIEIHDTTILDTILKKTEYILHTT